MYFTLSAKLVSPNNLSTSFPFLLLPLNFENFFSYRRRHCWVIRRRPSFSLQRKRRLFQREWPPWNDRTSHSWKPVRSRCESSRFVRRSKPRFNNFKRLRHEYNMALYWRARRWLVYVLFWWFTLAERGWSLGVNISVESSTFKPKKNKLFSMHRTLF